MSSSVDLALPPPVRWPADVPVRVLRDLGESSGAALRESETERAVRLRRTTRRPWRSLQPGLVMTGAEFARFDAWLAEKAGQGSRRFLLPEFRPEWQATGTAGALLCQIAPEDGEAYRLERRGASRLVVRLSLRVRRLTAAELRDWSAS